MLLAEPELDS